MIPNGTRVNVAHRTPRHTVATVIAQDDQRAAVATPHPCPYCGVGACLGSPRTAVGGDVNRFYRIHTGRGIPRRWRISTAPLSDLTPTEEH